MAHTAGHSANYPAQVARICVLDQTEQNLIANCDYLDGYHARIIQDSSAGVAKTDKLDGLHWPAKTQDYSAQTKVYATSA